MRTKDNCADLRTKLLPEVDMKRHLSIMSMEITKGRSVAAPVIEIITDKKEAKAERRRKYEGDRMRNIEKRKEVISKRNKRS